MSKAIYMGRQGLLYPEPDDGQVNLAEFQTYSYTPNALNRLALMGFSLCVISNERPIHKYGHFLVVLAKVERAIANMVCGLIEFKRCAHNAKQQCENRLPSPAFLLEFAEEHEIDLENSIMLAGRQRDIDAAKAAGVGHIIKVESGKADWAKGSHIYASCDTLEEVPDYILKRGW